MGNMLREKTIITNVETCRLRVYGGLMLLKGSSCPYFSLTADLDVKHGDGFVEFSGSCMPEMILDHFPELSDLAALHLSDEKGYPMYAKENGWYWAAGYLGGVGEEYHGGQGHTKEQCLQNCAKLVRWSSKDLAKLLEEFAQVPEAAKLLWKGWCDQQKERWENEAKACIKNHNLTVCEE